MKLIDTVVMNHHIEIYRDNDGKTLAKLLDHSGVGDMVDTSKAATADRYVWLVNGLCTPCSVDDIVYLSTKIPLSFTISDQDTGATYEIDHFALPPAVYDRERLLTVRQRDISDVEREIYHEEIAEPPDWYKVWKKATEDQTKSLF